MEKEFNLKTPLAVLLLLSIIIGGCSSVPKGPQFSRVDQIPDGKALIYIYRPSLPYEFGVNFDVKANEVLVKSVADGSYYPYFSNLGRVVLSCKRAGEKQAPIVLTVREKETYYVKVIPVRGVFRMKPKLTLMDKATAEAEIANTRLLQ